MNARVSAKLVRFFLQVLRARGYIATAFLLLTVAGIYGATRVPNDSAIERLVIPGDPVARATRDFERVFPEGTQALIMLETPDPLSLTALQAALQLERQLGALAHVEAHSLFALFPRRDATSPISAAEAQRMRAFATGTPLFRRAGLLGDHYLGIALELHATSAAERDRALKAIDSLALPLESAGGP